MANGIFQIFGARLWFNNRSPVFDVCLYLVWFDIWINIRDYAAASLSVREHPTSMYLKYFFIFALIQWITFPQNLFLNIFHVAGIHTGVPHSPGRRLECPFPSRASLRKSSKIIIRFFFHSQQLMTCANYNRRMKSLFHFLFLGPFHS